MSLESDSIFNNLIPRDHVKIKHKMSCFRFYYLKNNKTNTEINSMKYISICDYTHDF